MVATSLICMLFQHHVNPAQLYNVKETVLSMADKEGRQVDNTLNTAEYYIPRLIISQKHNADMNKITEIRLFTQIKHQN